MPFKSETLEEARDRLVAQSDAEKEGSEAAQRGILVGRLGAPTDPNSIEGVHLQLREEQRVMRSSNDIHEDETREGADVELLRRGRSVEEFGDEAEYIKNTPSSAPAPEEGTNDDGQAANQPAAEGQQGQRRGGSKGGGRSRR